MSKNNKVKVAAIQASYGKDLRQNIDKTLGLAERAIKEGAKIILPSELFESEYFCTRQVEEWFSQARPVDEHPCVTSMLALAKAHDVCIPISFFERHQQEYYNSVAVVDATGILGIYRKTHIPDGPGYQEKYYFRPGNTGFKVWRTKFATFGIGICWDQWFPECARAMALQGADLLFYPTAIGSEPYDSQLDTSERWQLAMRGHAVANAVGVIAANRIGSEEANAGHVQNFYGSSFICDHTGTMLRTLDKQSEGVIVHEFDLSALQHYRSMWGFFRDRRGSCYQALCE